MTVAYGYCCVPKCRESGDMNKILHTFPNPLVAKERFDAWVAAIGSTIINHDHFYIHKKGRVCRRHFEEKFKVRYNRLTLNAVPSLYLPDLPDSQPIIIDDAAESPSYLEKRKYNESEVHDYVSSQYLLWQPKKPRTSNIVDPLISDSALFDSSIRFKNDNAESPIDEKLKTDTDSDIGQQEEEIITSDTNRAEPLILDSALFDSSKWVKKGNIESPNVEKVFKTDTDFDIKQQEEEIITSDTNRADPSILDSALFDSSKWVKRGNTKSPIDEKVFKTDTDSDKGQQEEEIITSDTNKSDLLILDSVLFDSSKRVKKGNTESPIEEKVFKNDTDYDIGQQEEEIITSDKEETRKTGNKCVDCIFEKDLDKRNHHFGNLLIGELKFLPPCMRSEAYINILKYIDSLKNKHRDKIHH